MAGEQGKLWITGLPLSPDAELVTCTGCWCAVPALVFEKHGLLWHQNVMYVRLPENEPDPAPGDGSSLFEQMGGTIVNPGDPDA